MRPHSYYEFYRWKKMGPQSNYKLCINIKFSLHILPLLIPENDLIRPKNVLCLILKL